MMNVKQNVNDEIELRERFSEDNSLIMNDILEAIKPFSTIQEYKRAMKVEMLAQKIDYWALIKMIDTRGITEDYYWLFNNPVRLENVTEYTAILIDDHIQTNLQNNQNEFERIKSTYNIPSDLNYIAFQIVI